jgi:hypothetical protein
MEKSKSVQPPYDTIILDKVRAELNELDNELVEIEGGPLKPSQCYRVGINPLHVLFNTNCPDSLKKRVEAILSKYISPDESGAYQ